MTVMGAVCRLLCKPYLSPAWRTCCRVNAISFFAPQIFSGVTAFASAGTSGQLYAALLVNGVQWSATIITVGIVDKVGRQLQCCSAAQWLLQLRARDVLWAAVAPAAAYQLGLWQA